MVEKWEHETPTPWANLPCPEKQTATYPHAIVYDFEAYQDVSKAAKPTCNLTYESEHVPISVSLADTLNTEPEYIVSKDPNELIRLFHESLERRYEAILADVVARFRFSGTEGITDAQSKEILQWVTQVPVVGFNSGHYDLKLIRKYYVPLMAKDKEVFAAEKNGRIMFINTPKFKFLDVLNYLAPSITYDKWVKTYGATLTKSWLPYEWLDSPDKLDFPGLPPYMAWYSKLKGEYVLTLKEYDDCHRIFREKGMRTFGDWLEYYNNLDVAPFLEALQKMKEFYTDLGVDIFKDAVSLPGVSKQYLLRKTLQPRRGYKPPDLYTPNKEAYAMLKAAVVGGPSLVFTRKHVAGETHIRSHQYEDAKVCRRILGYDANSLYPSTMMKEMPCGPGVVTTCDNPEAAALVFRWTAHSDGQLIQMDTDSMYFAFSHEKLEDAVRPGYEVQFEEDKKRWLAWDKWSNREPCLFKLEKQATFGIALCSKCFFMEDRATGQAKVSSKGVNKRQNEMRAERFERALEGSRDMATNRGFRMHNGAMYTYEQRKLGLSAYYDKRWVLEDGIHTEPIEYHQ